jgi:hypothetical protein
VSLISVKNIIVVTYYSKCHGLSLSLIPVNGITLIALSFLNLLEFVKGPEKTLVINYKGYKLLVHYELNDCSEPNRFS